jgi:hypothetical protein
VGGSGGGGRVREDRVGGTIAVEAGSAYRGAAVDVSALDVVVPDAEIPLAGTGRPGAAVIVRNYSVTPAARTEGVVGADGTFAVRVPLQPGLNDLEVAQRDGAIEARSWIGTIFELSGTTVLGARIYVVRVPEVE